MVRNLSDFGFCYGLSIAYLREKSDWNYSVFGRGIPLGFTASWWAVLRAWLSVYPTPLHQLFYFLDIGFIDVARCVHSLSDLVQIAADFSERVVVFPQV